MGKGVEGGIKQAQGCRVAKCDGSASDDSMASADSKLFKLALGDMIAIGRLLPFVWSLIKSEDAADRAAGVR